MKCFEQESDETLQEYYKNDEWEELASYYLHSLQFIDVRLFDDDELKEIYLQAKKFYEKLSGKEVFP